MVGVGVNERGQRRSAPWSSNPAHRPRPTKTHIPLPSRVLGMSAARSRVACYWVLEPNMSMSTVKHQEILEGCWVTMVVFSVGSSERGLAVFFGE
jgi:hypothetical protein